MAIIFLDCYMAINLVYKYWKFNVGYHKAHLLRLLLMNAKKKKKMKRLHCWPLMFTKITLTSLVFLIVKRSMFFKTKLQSHFLPAKTVKSIKWVLNII